ncbi:hypothetical protein ATANTOWER_008451 [Ataeniobius toweri]|uniref:Uncharacterized protein n=1 Tax=Ataeniobius toweri TaxID=208326 RepID=A0ABU7BJD3_9TELE|nr:hypothetical protein [Ataeniobius toweri]
MPAILISAATYHSFTCLSTFQRSPFLNHHLCKKTKENITKLPFTTTCRPHTLWKYSFISTVGPTHRLQPRTCLLALHETIPKAN